MKKLITLLFASLMFTASVQAAGMVGVKLGMGELDAENKSYTAGSTTVAAQSGDSKNEYGALFAEFEIPSVDGLSLGLEYIPFTATIRLDKGESTTGADVDDYTTLYALYMKETADGNVYFKAGYSQADIGTVTNPNGTTVNAQDDSLSGPMVGVGFQSSELANGLVARVEATYTNLDDVSITTTSNGSTSVKKTGSGEITTFSVSLAKSF
tara:strand:+ start:335 stop:967 length:633 start_codon:yes stop_codon:yes gene_type:complete